MSGVNLLHRLHRAPALSGAPIMFSSGHAQPALRSLVLARGGSDFFVKPVDFDGLRRALETRIETARGFGGLEQ